MSFDTSHTAALPGSYITTPQDVALVSNHLSSQKIVAVDTEFIRETTFYPKIALIQLATKDKTWLVDPLAIPKEGLVELFQVFENPNVLKTMHAAYSDQECFYTEYGITAQPVLDTAIASALLGMGDNLGLGRLTEEVLKINLPKGRARARWLKRPLPLELLNYAEHDVAHLVSLAERLMEKLKAKDRLEWALEESRVDHSVFDVSPLDLARRAAKSGQLDGSNFCILVELYKWREHRAKSADLPRGWVADNETLAALTKSKPKSLEELKFFRGLKPKEIESQGDKILQAIRVGLTTAKDTYPKINRIVVPHGAQTELVADLLQSYVSYLAKEHEIAGRFLLPSNKTYQLIAYANRDLSDWVKDGLISKYASQLVGLDLKALLLGRRAMVVRDGRVEIMQLDKGN